MRWSLKSEHPFSSSSARALQLACRSRSIIDCLPADLVHDWDESSALGSPLHLLWQRVELNSGDFGIEAGVAGPEEVEYLHLAAGAPVLIRTLRYRDTSGRRPVLAGHTVHRGDLVRYSLNVPLSREKPPPPARSARSTPPGCMTTEYAGGVT